jgi:hypothetical protein
MKESGISEKEQINQLHLDIKTLEDSIVLTRREIAKKPLDVAFLEGHLEELILEKKEKVTQLNQRKRS